MHSFTCAMMFVPLLTAATLSVIVQMLTSRGLYTGSNRAASQEHQLSVSCDSLHPESLVIKSFLNRYRSADHVMLHAISQYVSQMFKNVSCNQCDGSPVQDVNTCAWQILMQSRTYPCELTGESGTL